jgi:hypothetical protein
MSVFNERGKVMSTEDRPHPDVYDLSPLPDLPESEGSFFKGLAWGILFSTIIWGIVLAVYLHAN